MEITKEHQYKGIKIAVTPHFLEKESNNRPFYVHGYKIKITNTNAHDVQLLQRHWEIYDSIEGTRVVKGPGVIGKTPILKTQEVFEYSSFCPLKSSIGKMKGFYQFKNLETEELFNAAIPEFHLTLPGILN